MQTAPQLQPHVGTQGQGIGTDLQLLHPGDARVGIVQISRTNTAPGSNCGRSSGWSAKRCRIRETTCRVVSEACSMMRSVCAGGQRNARNMPRVAGRGPPPRVSDCAEWR